MTCATLGGVCSGLQAMGNFGPAKMIAISVVVMLTVAGIAPALAIDRSQPRLALAGLAFLYGSGLVYVILLLQSIGGMRWSLIVTVTALLVICGASLLRIRRAPAGGAPSHVPLSWLDGGTALLIAAYAAYATITRPPHGDFWMIWGLKGRVFFEARGIDWQWLESNSNRYATLAPNVALAEAPLIAFGTAGLVMLRRAINVGDDGAMRHAAILLGLAGVTKNEGTTLFAAAVVAMVIARAPRRQYVAWWPALALITSWLALRAAHDLPADLVSAGVVERLAERLQSLPKLAGLMTTWICTPYLWPALAAGAAIASRRILRRETIILVAVGIQFVVFTAAYLATPHDVTWHVIWSWNRISRQLAAPLVFTVMSALAHTFVVTATDPIESAIADPKTPTPEQRQRLPRRP